MKFVVQKLKCKEHKRIRNKIRNDKRFYFCVSRKISKNISLWIYKISIRNDKLSISSGSSGVERLEPWLKIVLPNF